jgi:hypothetical protein
MLGPSQYLSMDNTFSLVDMHYHMWMLPNLVLLLLLIYILIQLSFQFAW